MHWSSVSRFGDLLLGAAVVALYAVEITRWDPDLAGAVIAVAVVAGTGLALRRRQPLVAFLLAAGSIEGITVVAPGFDNDSAALVITMFVSLYSLGRHAVGIEQWLGAVAVLAFVVLFVGGEADPSAIDSGDVGFALFFVGTPWGAGVAVRLRRERERALTEHNQALQRDQEARAREAVAEERARIARELHDVVAHAISVTVMQARGGRAVLGRDEDAVRRALDAIEQTNTAALSDMRRLLAVLRDTEGADEGRAAPQPSLANLDRLVEQVRGTGQPVELEVTGEAVVPPGVDLSAYRIVQEALTNVIKHAGPGAQARVRVDYGADALEVAVTDDGVGPIEQPDRLGGHGLVGIRERVAVVGGRVTAGPAADGGFMVTARLPYSLDADLAAPPATTTTTATAAIATPEVTA